MDTPSEHHQALVLHEIRDLHRFFEAWLGGELPDTDEVFAHLPRALAPEFVLVTPAGIEVARDALLDELRAAHGTRPGFRLWTEGAELLVDEAPLLVARYEELQRSDDATTRRVSTALFRSIADERVVWSRVHETWIDPPPGTPGGAL
jgi:hypothetical protein